MLHKNIKQYITIPSHKNKFSKCSKINKNTTPTVPPTKKTQEANFAKTPHIHIIHYPTEPSCFCASYLPMLPVVEGRLTGAAPWILPPPAGPNGAAVPGRRVSVKSPQAPVVIEWAKDAAARRCSMKWRFKDWLERCVSLGFLRMWKLGVKLIFLQECLRFVSRLFLHYLKRGMIQWRWKGMPVKYCKSHVPA